MINLKGRIEAFVQIHCEKFHEEAPELKTLKVAGKVSGFIIGSLLLMPMGAAFLMWLAH